MMHQLLLTAEVAATFVLKASSVLVAGNELSSLVVGISPVVEFGEYGCLGGREIVTDCAVTVVEDVFKSVSATRPGKR